MPEDICTGCMKPFASADLVEGLCPECRKALGLTPQPLPLLRPAGPCQRCGGPQIIQSLIRERAASGADYVHPYIAPLAVAHQTQDVRTFFSDRKKGVAPDLEKPLGIIVAYICRACGFTELYTMSPQEIPIGPEHGTQLLGFGSAYR